MMRLVENSMKKILSIDSMMDKCKLRDGNKEIQIQWTMTCNVSKTKFNEGIIPNLFNLCIIIFKAGIETVTNLYKFTSLTEKIVVARAIDYVLNHPCKSN